METNQLPLLQPQEANIHQWLLAVHAFYLAQARARHQSLFN